MEVDLSKIISVTVTPLKKQTIVYYLLLKDETEIIGFSKEILKGNSCLCCLCMPITLNKIHLIHRLNSYNIIVIKTSIKTKSYFCDDNITNKIIEITKYNNIDVRVVDGRIV